MEGVPTKFDDLRDAAEFRRPAQFDGVECYRAHIVRHAFEPHAHDGFGLGAIESGVERFRYRGGEHLAPPGSLVLMNPGELHTGRAETEGGWRYRMIYVDAAVVETITGEAGWWFRDAVFHDATTAARVGTLLDSLWRADEALEADGLMLDLLGAFRRHAKVSQPLPAEGAPRFASVIDFLHANLDARVSLAELAAVADLSPYHFLRSFQACYHVSPHQMLMALRLAEAKRLLATGVTAAQVAVTVGLSDQAHLTRAFSRRYGVTPAKYQRQVRC